MSCSLVVILGSQPRIKVKDKWYLVLQIIYACTVVQQRYVLTSHGGKGRQVEPQRLRVFFFAVSSRLTNEIRTNLHDLALNIDLVEQKWCLKTM